MDKTIGMDAKRGVRPMKVGKKCDDLKEMLCGRCMYLLKTMLLISKYI